MIVSDFGQLRIPDTTDLTELGQIPGVTNGPMDIFGLSQDFGIGKDTTENLKRVGSMVAMAGGGAISLMFIDKKNPALMNVAWGALGAGLLGVTLLKIGEMLA